VVFLVAWLARAGSRLSGLALGLIIGGALGNAIDRLAQGGAVIDFVLLHAVIGGVDRDWYVFNLADAAIVAGVIGLLYESVRPDRAAKVP
jgi:signal peptidase II